MWTVDVRMPLCVSGQGSSSFHVPFSSRRDVSQPQNEIREGATVFHNHDAAGKREWGVLKAGGWSPNSIQGLPPNKEADWRGLEDALTFLCGIPLFTSTVVGMRLYSGWSTYPDARSYF